MMFNRAYHQKKLLCLDIFFRIGVAFSSTKLNIFAILFIEK